MIQPTLISLLSTQQSFNAMITTAALRVEEKYGSPFWKKHFNWKYSSTLTWESFVGAETTAVAASVMDAFSPTPLRNRRTIGKLTGDIPAIGQKFVMQPKDLNDYDLLQMRLNANEATTLETLASFLYPDLSNAIIAPHKRLDFTVLYAMSTGKILWNDTNNPGGISFEYDMQFPSNNASVSWATTASSDPLTDIQTVMEAGEEIGYNYTMMRMTRATFKLMIASKKFQAIAPLIKNSTAEYASQTITLSMVNDYFSMIGYPSIELIDLPVRIADRAGNISSVKPFQANRVLFMTDAMLGDMYYSPLLEERHPMTNKVYSANDNVIISRWNEDMSEITEGKIQAFPAFSNTDSLRLLVTNPA